MPHLPSVAIVTPSYNQGAYLGATIESVLAQDYPAIDHVVMDACSTDETPAVLARYAGRVRAVVEPDGGQADAINKGFALARGDVLTWLNSDDTLAPGAVAAAAAFLAVHPDVAVVYGDATFIDAAGRHIARCAHVEPFNAKRLLHYTDMIVQPAAFFRRAAFDAVGGLDPALHYAMDYDLWLKLAAAGHKFAHVPRVWAHYRWLGENKSAVGGWKRLREVQRVAARYGRQSLPAYFKLEAVNLHLGDARAALTERRLAGAVGAVARAAGTVLGSPRAVKALCEPNTWRIIRTGRTLRAHAAR